MPFEAPLRRTRSIRSARRLHLATRSIRPTRASHIYRVEATGELPEWHTEQALTHFSHGPTHFWTRSRMFAQRVVKWVGEYTGEAEIIKAEYRRCQQCGREFLGLEAERLRMQIESCVTGDQLPCNPDCRPKFWRDREVKGVG